MSEQKKLYQELEKVHQDLVNNSEREKALLEGRVQFSEQQRDIAK